LLDRVVTSSTRFYRRLVTVVRPAKTSSVKYIKYSFVELFRIRERRKAIRLLDYVLNDICQGKRK